MSGRDCSRAPVYAARDLAAAEADAYARGRVDGYLDGYRDGKAGTDVEAAAQAAAFAAVVSATFRHAVPHAEILRRRAEASGHPHIFAPALAAAQAQVDRLQHTPTTERTAA